MATRKLAGKVAVVTGASKGIGAEIARQLAAEGAAVVVNYASSRTAADRVVSDIQSKDGKAVAVQADVAKKADVQRLFVEAKRHFGRVDILVNNAGVYEFLPLAEVSEAHFHKQYDTNVLGLLLASQEAAKQIGEQGGSIINISSVVSRATPPASSVYAGTKAAVDATTQVLAKELGARKIRVNAINPGMVETDGTHAGGIIGSEFQQGFEKQAALGRIGQPADIAPAVVFLASDDSSWITGEIFYIAGGFR